MSSEWDLVWNTSNLFKYDLCHISILGFFYLKHNIFIKYHPFKLASDVCDKLSQSFLILDMLLVFYRLG